MFIPKCAVEVSKDSGRITQMTAVWRVRGKGKVNLKK